MTKLIQIIEISEKEKKSLTYNCICTLYEIF